MRGKYLPITLIVFLFSVLLLGFYHTKLAFSVTGHAVISEVQVGGGTSNDEFIELYNPTDSAIDISSWSIQRETTGGTFEKKNFEAGDSMSAHGFFLIAHSAYDGSVTPDLTHSSFTLSSTGNTVFLVNDQILLTTGEESTIVDKVAIGSSALDAEGTAISTVPPDNGSIERKPGDSDPSGGNGEDTDDNSSDFNTRTVSESQNNSSATESPTLTPTNTPSPTETPTPSLTETPTPTPTETPTPTLTPTETPTQTPTETPTPTEEPTPTLTPTETPEETPSPTPSLTPTPTEAGPEPFFTSRLFDCHIDYITIERFGFTFIFPQFHCLRNQ